VRRSPIGWARQRARALLVGLGWLRAPSVRYCIDNDLLASVLTGTPGDRVRAALGLPPSDRQTQLNQDIFALLMNRFRPGFFLEIGANDGFTLSNTVYLEEEFGWKGVLVEANPRYVASLSARTGSVIVNKAVAARKGEAAFIDAGLYGGLKSSLDGSHAEITEGAASITVECIGLQELLDAAAAPPRIDFVSVDVEGGELPVVEQMIAGTRRYGCGCIEFNARSEDYSRMASLLDGAGYRVVWANQTQHDLFFVDAEMPLARDRVG
jgi:FkbM family methyltransferase